ncbi:myosin-2-like [Typha latifolia]|uniref:myosin-2-like n=1 Tax=Typha latifolia TaxID=4733 RepID=UPI003C2E88EE
MAHMVGLVTKSSLEVMLDTIMQRDEQPKDVPPALPARPVSHGRLPTSRRFMPVDVELEAGVPKSLFVESKKGEAEIEDRKNREDKDVVLKSAIFGSKRITSVEQEEESPSVKMAELEGYLESLEESDRTKSPAVVPPSVVPVDKNLQRHDTKDKKETNGEHLQVDPSFVEKLQMQVLKAELALEEKEQHNAHLQRQLQHYEKRWSEYEAKMKSMEETWQKELVSLQLSLAAAKKSSVSDDVADQPGKFNALPNHHSHNSKDVKSAEAHAPDGKQPYPSEAAKVGTPNEPQNAVKYLAKEFEQRRLVFEDDVDIIVAANSGQSNSHVNPDEDLRKLKARFTAWKKDYKARLREAKTSVQKIGNHEEKAHKRWWGKRSTK